MTHAVMASAVGVVTTSCDEPPSKKPKSQNDISSAVSWILIPSNAPPPTFQVNDTVFWRSKSAKELGRRGTVVAVAAADPTAAADGDNCRLGGVDNTNPQHQQQQQQRVTVRFQKESPHNNNNNNSQTIIHGCTNTTTTQSTAAAAAAAADEECNYYEKQVSVKRLLPVFVATQQQKDDGTTNYNNDSIVTIIVTAETTSYRHMASSQFGNNNGKDDYDNVVLEIGCSTGEASAILVQYCNSWVGLDTSETMVRQCRQRLSQVKNRTSTASTTANNTTNNNNNNVFQVDALADPVQAEHLVLQGLHGVPPNTIFIDIGGNRDCDGVWRMLAWAMRIMRRSNSNSTTPPLTTTPTLVVIKSRELVAQMLQNKEEGVVRTTSTASTTTTLTTSAEWMEMKLQQLERQRRRRCNILPSHPLQAPLRHVVVAVDVTDNNINQEKPICRYHNYHKDGCMRYRNKSNECPLDHDHCHWCLESGHVARHCPLVVTALAEQERDD